MKAWYRKHPENLRKLKESIAAEFPDLRVFVADHKVQIKGTFPLIVEGKLIKRYSVLIELPNDYPRTLPIVYEIGGQIPRIIDRHVDERTGAACLFLPDERWRHFLPGAPFVEFLKGPVHDFFLWQASMELTGRSPFPARPHGEKGIIEFYSEILGTDNLNTIIKCVDYLSRKEVKGHWDCFCGSGKRMRHCHYGKLLDLREKIFPQVAKDSLSRLTAYQHHKSDRNSTL